MTNPFPPMRISTLLLALWVHGSQGLIPLNLPLDGSPRTGTPRARAFAATLTTITFRQGSSGYTGAGDTYIDSAAATTSHATATSLTVDLASSVKQALVRFEGLFTSQGGPIPDGATIDSATLTINVTNVTTEQIGFHRMVRIWSATDTWNTFGSSPWNGTPGIQLDGVEALASADASSAFPATGPASVDVTSSLRAWSSDPASRFGWVLNETVDNSVVFDSSDGATIASRPLLSVTYTSCSTPQDCDDGNPCTDDTCNAGACAVTDDDSSSCTDGIACTTDQCSGGACVSACGCPDQVCNHATGLCETPAPLPVGIGDTWKYFKGMEDPPPGWNTVCFNDSSWFAGPGGFGYGPDCNASTERNTSLSDMQNPPNSPGYQSLYARRVFHVLDPGTFSGLNLTVDYDDGFVAYLNGTEVARSASMGGTVGTQPPSNAAPTGHECSLCDGSCNATDTVPVATGLLVPGVNVLAIQGHNTNLGSSDFTVVATLAGTTPPNPLPGQPTNPSPANGGIGVSTPPTLCVDVSDPNNDPLTVTFQGRQATGSPGEDFTIIALPDTQFYAQSIPATFNAQTQWIVDNTESRNIVFVTQLGDCTNDGDSIPLQWTRADAAFDLLESPMPGLPDGMPFGIAVGNHDQTPGATARTGGSEIGTTGLYNQTFGRGRFCPAPLGTCRGYFGDNYTFGGVHPLNMDNHYELFSAGGMDFIAFHLEWDDVENPTRQAVLSWVDDLLSTTHSNRRAIISAHHFLTAGGSFSNQGLATWNALKDRPNVFLMLCGHADQSNHREDPADDAHTVYTLLSDYQTRPNGGNGWLRIMTFSPQNDTIHVETYSPTVEGGRFINKPTPHADDLSNEPGGNELILSYDMEAGLPFTTIGTNTNVPSGNRTCVQWTGLLGQSHEWYVTVSDGTSITSGPTWSFDTTTCTGDAECNDSDACNGVESCQNQICVAGVPPSCGDGNPCTDDSCGPVSGCANTADDTNSCSDGDPDTIDTCSSGACSSSLPEICASNVDCDDADACTADACDQANTAALSFDGVNDYVTMGAAAGLNASPSFTIEAWIQGTGGVTTTTGTRGIDGAIPLVTKGRGETETPANVNTNYFLGLKADALVADFEDAINGTNHPACSAEPIPNPTAWHHVAATYDGSCWQLYVDGQAQVINQNCWNCASNCPAQTTCPGVAPEPDSIQRFALGSALRSASNPEQPEGFYAGQLDEVRVWNLARTQAEIEASMNAQRTSGTGLIGRFGLNDGAGGTAADSDPDADGTAHDGTLTPASPDGPVWVTESADLPVIGLDTCSHGPIPNCCTSTSQCDDLSPCTIDTCADNACEHAPIADCCLTAADCADGDPCTTDSCASQICDHPPTNEGGACNDANACTTGDVCSGGTCSGTPNAPLCDDSVPCTADSCAGTPNPGALSFDGQNDYVTMGAAPSLNVSPGFTIETWFQWDGGGAATSTGAGGVSGIPLVTKGRAQTETPANVNMNYFLGIAGGRLVADFEDSATGLNHPVCTAASTPEITTGVWHHAAASYDGECWRLYLDGNAVAVDTLCSSCEGAACDVCPGPGVAPEPNSIQRFALGSALRSEASPEQPAGFYSGQLDEVRVWNHSRDAAQILASRDRRIVSALGLVGRFGLDEGEGQTVGDSTGNASDGVLTNMPADPWVAASPSLTSAECSSTPAPGCCATSADCDDANVCSDDSCDVSSHQCVSVANSAPCDDGSACTTGDVCSGGACSGAPSLPLCDDSIPCTADACADVSNQGALSFDGDDYVTMGVAPSLNVSPGFTLETWFLWDGGGAATGTGNGGITAIPLVTKGRAQAETANLNMNYFLGISGGRLVADFEDSATGLNHPVCTAASTPEITTGVWHHAAATYDGDCWQLYLDGNALVLDTLCSTCVAAACDTCPGPGVAPEPNSIQRFALGSALRSESSPEQPAGFYSGLLDEVRVWNYSRDPAQILANRDRRIVSALGLVGRFGLDEGQGQTVGDSTGDPSDGVLANMPADPWVTGAPNLASIECSSTPAAGCCAATLHCEDANVCTDDSCNTASHQCLLVANSGPCSDANACTTGDVCSNGSCLTTPIPNCCNSTADCNDGNDCTQDDCSGNTAAISLAGAADYVNLGNDGNTAGTNYLTNFGTDSFTVEGWFYANSAPTASLIGIFRQGRQGNFPQVVVQTVQTTGPNPFNNLGASVETSLNGTQVDTAVPIKFSLGAWHHFAAVVDRTAGNQKLILIVDGSAATMNTTTANVWGTNAINDTLNGADREPVLLGTARSSAGALINNFDGRVDEIRIWDRARTLAEIQQDMDRQVVSAGRLRHRWAMNEGGGTTTADSGGTPTGPGSLVLASWLIMPSQVPAYRSECAHAVTNEAGSCSDGNACTTGERCASGACGGGGATNCDDLNGCTDDSCDLATGCVHLNNATFCDDLDYCTTGEVCAGGSCGSGTTVACGDGRFCTDDACDPATGCVSTPHACADGLACTADACNEEADRCDHTPNDGACGDGQFCTDNTCDPATGCVATPHGCADGVACTVDTCNEEADRCDHAPDGGACSDGQFCTDNACDPATGCVTTSHDCDDGVSCTVDACDEAADRCDHAADDGACSDGEFCTDDTCDPATGCVTTPHDCDDAVSCTVDACNEAADRCDPTPDDEACSDGQFCTDNACDPATGCVTTSHDCNDGVSCTVDACNEGADRCDHAPNGAGCDDGNPCTDDACDPATGCVNPADNTNLCTDGNACTVDSCVDGACISSALPCDDGNPCTDDSCQAGNCINAVDDTNTCSDGSACTSPDVCRAGACACGQVVTCAGTTASFAGSGPVTIPNGPAVVTSTATVAGAGAHLERVRVTTFIGHTRSEDLDVTLTSPAGTVVTLTTDNGGSMDHVFNGTVWDDAADPDGQVPYTSNQGLASDHQYTDNVVATTLVPEEALAAFDGENPNGIWTLRISDDTSSNAGVLSSWSVQLTTRSAPPILTSGSVSNTTDAIVPELGSVASSVTVSGRTGRIGKVRVTTFLTHQRSEDLDMTLRSPAGTVVTLTTDNGGTLDHVFNGTVWDDDADPDGQVPYASNAGIATDQPYANVVTATPLAPEEALGAFKDEDPNGTWTLTISDDRANFGGLLDRFTLEIVTAECIPLTCELDCDDGNPCTDDACDPATGCVNPADSTNPCTDGNACTVDSCVDGACISSALPCDDGNPCTDDSCQAGNCINAVDDTNTCSDGSACTSPDVCRAGACVCGQVVTCAGTTASFAGSGPVTIPNGPAVVTSTATVAGAGAYLERVRVTTFIGHTRSEDLDVTLTSPAGTVVTLTTDNGGSMDHVFNGTVWDDAADPDGQVPYTSNQGLASDHQYTDNVVATTLVPEEALAAFDGENPNGIWTLRISDDTSSNAGVLSSWSVQLTTRSAPPILTSGSVSNTTDAIVPELGSVASSVTVSGRTGRIGKVRVTTFLTHQRSEDLDMTLRSPAGTVVTLTTDNGGTLDHVFNGTVWDDDADPDGQVPYASNAGIATDQPYANVVTATPLAPEEALGAFKDEDPNGTWTLTISDDRANFGGLLDRFTLEIVTAECIPLTCELDCDDGNPCTDDGCDPATGCVNAPNGSCLPP